MNPFNTLQLQRCSDGVATLWLDRPDKHNAFNAEMIAELAAILSELAEDPTLRLLLLRGRGKHFCAGADLAWMQASARLDYTANLADAQALGDVLQRLYELPVPTLAVVHGAAFGGAVGLTACCDIAIGTDDALFSLSEVRIGLVPAVISPYVVQAIGARACRRYALSAERFDGDRARELGLLAETCAAAALDASVERWCAMLLNNGPQALRACKQLLATVGNGALSEETRCYTERTIAAVRVSAEGQEGLQAFLDKRRPNWA